MLQKQTWPPLLLFIPRESTAQSQTDCCIKRIAMLDQRGGIPYIPEINTADAGLTDRKMCPCFSSVFFRITRIK